MGKRYVELEALAHLFYTQNTLEKGHREKTYSKDPRLEGIVELEVKSTLFQLFSKIVSIVELSNPIPDYERKRLVDKADMRGEFFSPHNHPVLK